MELPRDQVELGLQTGVNRDIGTVGQSSGNGREGTRNSLLRSEDLENFSEQSLQGSSVLMSTL